MDTHGMTFPVRGLEIHSSRMWRWQSVERALDVMQHLQLNTLILHQNDIMDQIVGPARYFSERQLWARWPVRLHVMDNNKQYVRQIIREASRRRIAVYFEVKEVWFADGLLDLYPALRKPDGTLCPTDPFWWELLGTKVSEILDALPDLAGVIVSPSTRESRVSISTNQCTCDRCESTTTMGWYRDLLSAMYQPLSQHGKKLVVRDFAYTVEQQNATIAAATAVSSEIVVALKNTPHDFYPTFPNNPRIGTIQNHPQWVEFDTWGQFFGLGFFPCSVVEDMQMRLKHCRESGVSGVWFRTDWEGLTEASSFNSPNLVNVFGGGLLSQNPDRDIDEVYSAWGSYGFFSPLTPESAQGNPVPLGPEAVRLVRDLMERSWEILQKTIYVRGHLFHEDCMFPSTLYRIFDIMVNTHGRDAWEPGASRRVSPTEENIGIIAAEKEAALTEVLGLQRSFGDRIANMSETALPASVREELRIVMELYVLYVRGFKACSRVCFDAKRAELEAEPRNLETLEASLGELAEFRNNLQSALEGKPYPHYTYWLLDADRLRQLEEDSRKVLAASGR